MEREQVFDEDYLYFYETFLTDELSDAQAERIWRVLELEPGTRVLDVACGHGRIANRLAERGARVTGIDATPLFLELAREDAARRGADVDYVQGDVRELPWDGEFDRAVSWFTSFGYFDDADNRRVLAQVHDVLVPGGRFLLDLNNLAALLRGYEEEHVVERDGDRMVDRSRFDPVTCRNVTERTVVRGPERRSFEVAVRMFTFPELRQWLLDAGFRDVEALGGDGAPLTIESWRMLTLARR